MRPAGEKVILFTPKPIHVNGQWNIPSGRPMPQKLYTRQTGLNEDTSGIIPLTQADVPAMLELTGANNLGPFFRRTIEFGYYEGIFNGKRLIAMIGQWMRPGRYTEVSAVCTHPDFTGKGLAAKLLQHQIDVITAASGIPFQHVYPENPACHLYKKVGFTIRRTLIV